MFTKVTFGSFALLGITAWICIHFHFTSSNLDLENYKKLIKKTEKLADKKSIKNKNFEQVRQNVQKDLWLTEKGEPTHYQIKTEHSILQIDQASKKLTIEEKMQNVVSILEQNGDTTNFQTNEALFQFPPNQIQTASCQMHHTSSSKESYFVKANQSLITLESKIPQMILRDQVQISSKQLGGKETFGLSDLFTLNLKQKSISLQSDVSKKVLFWQDDLRLSSKEVQIFKDPITQTQTVKGFGNVRFSFNLEEQNLFHEIFGK